MRKNWPTNYSGYLLTGELQQRRALWQVYAAVKENGAKGMNKSIIPLRLLRPLKFTGLIALGFYEQ